MSEATSPKARIVGFMVFGAFQDGDLSLSPVEFPDGNYRIFTDAEAAVTGYQELLSDPVLEWKEEDLVIVPIKIGEGGELLIPAGLGPALYEKENKGDSVTC